MNSAQSFTAPQLDALKLAWLEELGVDRRLLLRFSAQNTCVFTESASEGASQLAQAVPSAQTGSPVAADVRNRTASPPSAKSDEVAAARERLRSMLGRNVLSAEKPAPVTPGLPKAEIKPALATGLATLDALRHEVMVCQACSLHQDRGTSVFGDGATHAPAWLVIGEAPGAADDRAGIPFQGRAGELLRAMLKAIGADVSAEVFFTNVVKCRPMANRPPVDAEISQCGLHLRAQIGLLKPQRILALGRIAATALTGKSLELEALRGQVWEYACVSGRRIPVVVTYHPGWLLTHPHHKPGAWQDLRLARDLDVAS